jgi:hypothetical protein
LHSAGWGWLHSTRRRWRLSARGRWWLSTGRWWFSWIWLLGNYKTSSSYDQTSHEYFR